MKNAIDELKTIDPTTVTGPQQNPSMVKKYKELVKEITANFDEFHEQNQGGGNAHSNAKQIPSSNNAAGGGNANLHNDAFVGYTFNWKNKDKQPVMMNSPSVPRSILNASLYERPVSDRHALPPMGGNRGAPPAPATNIPYHFPSEYQPAGGKPPSAPQPHGAPQSPAPSPVTPSKVGGLFEHCIADNSCLDGSNNGGH